MASLVIVSLLFFVLSLVAAYTNRNLIFEQKTSSNQYRSTLALEAAEAGIAWALSMLNAGRLAADSCAFETDPTSTSPTFRTRYLDISPANGAITLTAAGASSHPTCVFDGTDWDCVCPTTGSTLPAAPDGNGLHPAFRVRFVASTTRPDMVFLESQGCTRRDETCLAFPGAAVPGEGRARIEMLVSLRSALPATPAAAMTVRGTLDAEDAALGAYNPVAGSSGIAYMSGSARVNAGAMRLGGAPGSPSDTSLLVIEDDEALALPALDAADRPVRMFSNTLLVMPDTYRDQPATVLIDCSTGCDADRIRDHADLNPGRVLWAEGNVDLDAGGDIGSVANPVILVVNGNFNLAVTLYGVVYGKPDDWTVTGNGELRGALIAGNDMSGGATLTVVRDLDVLNDLRFRSGSFVRSIGRWKDF